MFDEKEVLTKAMDLFWKQGYAATSIQDLVGHLGINRASMYDTFGGKEALFSKAFEYYMHTNLLRTKLFFASQTQVKAAFRKLFRDSVTETLQDCDKKGCFVVNTTTEQVPGDEKILKVLEENKKRFVDLFYDFLKKGIEEGQFKTKIDLKSIALMLYTLHNGLQVVAKVQTDKEELLKMIEVPLSLLD